MTRRVNELENGLRKQLTGLHRQSSPCVSAQRTCTTSTSALPTISPADLPDLLGPLLTGGILSSGLRAATSHQWETDSWRP